MNLLRSEDIHLVKLVFTKNSAFDVMYGLSQVEGMQIIDLNKEEQVYNLTFSQEVKQCNEIDRKLQYIRNDIKGKVHKP